MDVGGLVRFVNANVALLIQKRKYKLRLFKHRLFGHGSSLRDHLCIRRTPTYHRIIPFHQIYHSDIKYGFIKSKENARGKWRV